MHWEVLTQERRPPKAMGHGRCSVGHTGFGQDLSELYGRLGVPVRQPLGSIRCSVMYRRHQGLPYDIIGMKALQILLTVGYVTLGIDPA